MFAVIIMTNAEIFIERYKRLEKAVKFKYALKDSDSVLRAMQSDESLRDRWAEIKLCQSVRNLLQHEPKLDSGYPIEPSDELLDILSSITDEVEARPRCIDIATKNVFSGSPTAKVLGAVKTMRERGFTTIPVVKKHRVVGVFDHARLFAYISDSPSHSLGAETSFSDIADYLTGDKLGNTYVLYVRPDEYAEDLRERVERLSKRAKRLSAAFVTDTGDKSGSLLGMITMLDILKV